MTALAPFTGGGSLAFLPGALAGAGVGTALSGAFSGAGAKKKTSDDDDIQALIAKLQTSSGTTSAKGAELSGLGSEALRPVLQYFKSIIGGDPNALMEATRPERSRVIDQYDTARKNISEFGARGGGTNSVVAQSRFDEADTLANLTATARREAVGQAGNLGATLEGLGLSADQLASADLNTVIQAILSQKGLDLTKSGQNKQMAAGLAEGLGTLLGLFLTRGSGVANA